MTFWRFGYHATSAIDSILSKEDVSLEELLCEDELLQECKAHNTKLLDYLRNPEILGQLLRYVISDTLDDRQRFKLPFVASEVLASEVWSIVEGVMENTHLLVEFWQFLDRDPPLNPLQASYFSKVIAVLLQKKTKEMLQFIRAQPEAVQKILNHMETSAVMDLLLKLISLEEHAEGQGVVDWLASEGLILTLVQSLDPNLDPERHGIAAQVLLDIIAISQSSNPEQPSIGTNALIRELKGEEMLTRIVNYMLDPLAPNSTSSLINGVTIFIELIRRNYCDYEPQLIPALPRPPVNLSDLLYVLGSRVGDFQALLVKPKSIAKPMDSTMGKTIPLGFERLKICELFAELLHCSNMGLLNMLDPPPEYNEGIPSSDPRSVSGDTVTNDSAETQTPAATEEGTKLDDAIVADAPELAKEEPVATPPVVADVQPIKTPFVSKIQRSPGVPVGDYLKLQFVRHRILPSCIELFFTFAWNNFLHTVVYDMIHQILNGRADEGSSNRELMMSIFRDTQLTKKITMAQRLCDHEVEQPKGLRTGYMGHLTFISEEVVNCFERHPSVMNSVRDLAEAEDWQEYVHRILRETKERDRQALGGARPATRVPEVHPAQTDDDDEDDEGLEAVADGDMASDQFARYLCHQITSDLPDKFGSSDDEDEDEDEEVGWIGDFDRGSAFDMRSAFGSPGLNDPFDAHHRFSTDDSFDDSDDEEEILGPRWPGDVGPSEDGSPKAVAETQHPTNLTVADWNADFERSFDRQADDLQQQQQQQPGPATTTTDDAAATEIGGGEQPSWAQFESAFGSLKLTDSEDPPAAKESTTSDDSASVPSTLTDEATQPVPPDANAMDVADKRTSETK